MTRLYKRKLVYSVGINDANYDFYIRNGSKIVWYCPYYEKWRGMLRRCYSEKYITKNPSYKGCSVCEEWLTFSNFKAWMENQDWQEKELDKDILGNGKLYSVETCCFVSKKLNSFVAFNRLSNCELPVGVSFHKIYKKFSSSVDGKLIGFFETKEEAHDAWIATKINLAKDLLLQEKVSLNIYEKVLYKIRNANNV